MSRELFNTWSDYQQAITALLDKAEHRLCIYDPDLAQLKLDEASRLTQLKRLLQNGRADCVRIAVRNAQLLRSRSPRLMELLTTYGHLMHIVETPENLAHLRDCMILADGCHGLIRFDQDQARCKLLLSEVHELMPYQNRFEEIWEQGNQPISPTTLGL